MSTLVDAVSGSEIDRHLRAIAAVVRLSGTPEEAAAFDYIESQLRSFGYDVARHESDAGAEPDRRQRLLPQSGHRS